MTATRDRNAVLFFVVPSRHRFVVLGDKGINEKVGREFWLHIAHVLSERLHDGDFNGGLAAGIEEVGERLATFFPRLESDTNELPTMSMTRGGSTESPWKMSRRFQVQTTPPRPPRSRATNIRDAAPR
jgi:uncharacterized membrane protein